MSNLTKIFPRAAVYLCIISMAVSGVAIAQNNYMQQQRQIDMQRQQVQQQMRQQPQDLMRRQQQDQMRQQMRQQQADQLRQQIQQQVRQQQAVVRDNLRQQQVYQTKQLLQDQVRQQSAAQRAQVLGRPAPTGTSQAISNRTADRMVFSNGVAKLTKPLTASEIKRGFTGKVTEDGRALVKFQNRVVAIPSSRVGVTPRRTETSQAALATGWSPQKQNSIKSDIHKLASVPPGGGKGGISDTFNRAAIRTGDIVKVLSPQVQSRIDAALSARNIHSSHSLTALDEIKKLPKLQGMRQKDIATLLKYNGFTSSPARSGGTVWIKSLPDGNTAVVRLDPPRKNAREGNADSVEHAHKEIVPTKDVINGDYGLDADVMSLNDDCVESSCIKEKHIRTTPESN